MEIHHAHQSVHKKNWIGYLSEFLMLFLAVFLGFLAENKREHMVNANKEKRYMQSMVEDLQMDTTILKVIMKRAEGVMTRLDTMSQTILHQNLNDSAVKQLYRLNLPILSSIQISLTDRTSSQLKNAGGLNLVHNEIVVKALFDYWTSATEIENNAANYNELRMHAREKSYSIFSAKFYTVTKMFYSSVESKASLMTTDPAILTEFANRLNHLKNSIQFVYLPNLDREYASAIKLIGLIRKEYHLKEGMIPNVKTDSVK